MTPRAVWLWTLLALAAAAAAGCGDDAGGGDADGDVEPDGDDGDGDGEATPPATCVRDEALLAERRDCRLDEDCPCGAHCALGLCAHDCLADGDCDGGGWCDRFGRCRDAGSTELVEPVVGDPRAVLEVSPRFLEILGAGAERVLRLRATERPAGPVRVAAGEGLEVQCDPSAGFAAECAFESIGTAADDSRVVRVRFSGTMPATGELSRDVAVFTGGQRIPVGVRVAAPAGGAKSPADGVGVYHGYAWPVGAGLSSRLRVDPLSEHLSRVRIPVTARVYPLAAGTHVLTLSDVLRGIFPDEETVGRLYRDTGGAWQLEIVAHRYLGPEAPAGEDLEVTMDAASEEVSWADGRLEGLLRIVHEGAMVAEDAPFVQWRFAVAWAEDLPAGATAPPLPDPYVPALEIMRAENPLAVETLALGELPIALGDTAAEHASAAICTEKGRTSPLRRLIESVWVVDTVPSPSGDLACETVGRPQPTFPLLAEPSFAVSTKVADCLEDLSRTGSATDVLTSTGCIDAARVLTALGLALETDRSRALHGTGAADPQASALAHRLLQQWLALHAFLGREAAEVQALNDILPEAERHEQTYSVIEALRAGIAGWDALLLPRVAAGLAVMPPAVLNAPDYRARLFPSAEYPDSRSHEQPVGLPVTMLRALRDQLDVLARLVEQARAGAIDYADVEPLLTDFARRAFVVLGLAQGLYDSARSVGAPAWDEEWNVARVDYGAAIAGLLRAIEDLGTGRNVLGIEDSDLPIYRIGDEVGANDRFSALTDYLLGVGTDAGAVAPFMVARAQTALDAARASWTANVQRDYTAQLQDAERSRRVEAVNRRYGEEITGLCGRDDWDSSTILAIWDEVDPNTCYLRDECRFTTDQLRQRVSGADLGFNLCFAWRLRQRFGSVVTTGSEEIDALLDAVGPALYAADAPFDLAFTDVAGDSVFFTAAGTSYSMPWTALDGLAVGIGETTEAESDWIAESRSVCNSARQATLAARPVLPPATCALADDCPVDYVCASGACVPDTGIPASGRPECFVGGLGAVAIAVQSAAQEVEIARSEMADLQRAYDIAVRTCAITSEHQEGLESTLEQHTKTMDKLGAAKLAMDIAANMAAATKEACSIDTCFSGGGTAAAAYAEATFRSISDGLQYAMDEAEHDHELTMMKLEHEMEQEVCANDAKLYLVGQETAALRVQQALLDLAQNVVEFRNLKDDVRGLCAEGHAALENELNRRVDPLVTDFWLADRVEQYRAYLRQARRAVYLAVLATEYEFQFSSSERTRAMSAAGAAELQEVIDNLRTVALTGTVGGASPANLFTVLSLGSHLLQIADRSTLPDGWHALSPAERFRTWLNSPVHAVYDAAGEYLGQEVHFTLAPLGTIGIGDPSGIPILAGTDCAERLWSVNASLQGTDLFVGGGTFTRVVLRKRNTFYSQWCDDAGRADEFQMASTRPSRNLFLDPYGPEASLTPATPTPDTTSVDEVNAFSNARISAYFNISRAELEDESYFNGDSQELAGRGLYGDYALFFPAETLSTDGGDGLVLTRVDDALLRFDYVSVAR